MTGAEYRKLLQHFRLSQHRAAAWLGVSPRTGQNYAKKGPPEPVARFLRAWVRLGLSVADLADVPLTVGGINRSPNPYWKNPATCGD